VGLFEDPESGLLAYTFKIAGMARSYGKAIAGMARSHKFR
jgi:hypothetical protein